MWEDLSSYWFWGWFHSFIPSRMFYLWSQESSSAISDYENCQHAITQNNINIQNKNQKNMQQAAQEIWGQNKKGFFLSCYQKNPEKLWITVSFVSLVSLALRQWCPEFEGPTSGLLLCWREVSSKGTDFSPGRSCCHFWLQFFYASYYCNAKLLPPKQLSIPLESGKSIWKLLISFDGVHNRKSKNLCYCELAFVYGFRRFRSFWGRLWFSEIAFGVWF